MVHEVKQVRLGKKGGEAHDSKLKYEMQIAERLSDLA